MDDDMTAVETRGVSKRFGPVTVLTEVDFDVRKGEVHALAGGNGAGKSTLMKIIQGVHQPDAGEAEQAGQRGAVVTPREIADRLPVEIGDLGVDLAREAVEFLASPTLSPSVLP